jgi:hypothetical protein
MFSLVLQAEHGVLDMAISVLNDEDVPAVGRSADAVKLDGKPLYYTVRVFGIEWLTKSGKKLI